MIDAVRQLIEKRRGLFGPAALFISALLIGGGGPHAPIPVALLETGALLLLVFQLVSWPVGRAMSKAAYVGGAIAIAYLVFGSLQLIPLAPQTWQSLPGRTLLLKAMTTAGQNQQSWPVSLSPQDTRDVLLAVLPPLAIFITTVALPPRTRLSLARLAVVAAVGSALLGVAQLAAGDGTLFPYGLPPYTRLPGVFANFNHQATLLTMAFILLVAIEVERPSRDLPRRLGSILMLVLLAIGTLITSSRAGLGLLAVAGAAGLLLWVSAGAARRTERVSPANRRQRLMIIAAGLVGVGLLSFVFIGSYRGDLMANRFGEAVDDLRFTFWINTVQAIRQGSEIGSGLGTFDYVYQSVEPLSQIDKAFVNHAHNDYLELALELGWGGLVVIVAAFLWLGWRLIAAVRRPVLEPGVALARAGGVMVLIVMAHSIVDYPLRTEAIGCLFSFACALLVNEPAPEEIARVRSRTRSRVRKGTRTRALAG